MQRIDANHGFTLIELAVALFLLALVFGTVFMPLSTRMDLRQVEATQRQLVQAREALLGYAALYGHLPCPADETSGGHEAPGSDHQTGHCPTWFGYLPAATLGLRSNHASGYAVDAWSTPASRVRYAVSDSSIGAAANPRALTRVNGLRAAGIAALGDPALSLLHVCAEASGVLAGRHCGAAPTLVSTAPFMLWSSGPNALTGGRSADEAQNPSANGGSADRIFVSKVRGASGEFDDLLAWLPMPRLISTLLQSGHLP